MLAPDSAWDGVKCSEPDIVELDGGGFRLFYEACDGTAEGTRAAAMSARKTSA